MIMALMTDSFDSVFAYVQRLPRLTVGKGLGWIPYQQRVWCDVCDKLLHASGNTTWYHKTFLPFEVEYDKQQHCCFVTHVKTKEQVKVSL
jgi:hypothetical protein